MVPRGTGSPPDASGSSIQVPLAVATVTPGQPVLPLTVPLRETSQHSSSTSDASADSTNQDSQLPVAESDWLLGDLPEPSVDVSADFPVQLKPGHQIRKYQKELAEPGINGENYIIVAPTGSGKTLVAATIISDHLKKNPSAHVVFVVNTKPLAEQQKSELDRFLPRASVDVFTGDTDKMVADSIKEHHNHISVCTAGKLLDEVRKGMVEFSQLSLMVFDECHHARKGHPYARLMECYFEYREKQGKLPQIIGMTASPGAGDNPDLDKRKTINHLMTLAAVMDASSGFKSVTENREELQQSTKNSEINSSFLEPRNPKEDSFISKVADEMTTLEAFVPKVKNNFEKWSQEYETRIQQVMRPLEMSTDPKHRDEISTLKLLRCYSNALNVYMDLQQQDAIQVMEKHDGLPGDDSQATALEREIKGRMHRLLGELNQLSPKKNPLLEGMKSILSNQFNQSDNSRGILFVRTKKHASAMRVWVLEHPELNHLIHPDVITGHTGATGAGMTIVEQKEVMKRFHTGETNFLIATSVAEEGLDVPECNFVIRFQHVSNEIAKVQTEGRARAENAQGFTILSSDSRKKYQELKNNVLVILVNQIFENGWFPSGEHLRPQLAKIQEEILNQKKLKATMRKRCSQSNKSEDVKLFCKKCKTAACGGSDVYTIGTEPNFHYVVPHPEFEAKYTSRPHPTPRYIANTVEKTEKINCSNCNQDWGSRCIWPSDGHKFPVIKCASFIFEIGGSAQPIKKWSSAPFEIKPLSVWLKNHDSSNSFSSSDTDELSD